ncbi:MAG: V-type ATPase subunit [Candidatus Woesearchaeota archaeon]|jgi:vacuolar-type H+-ATPase subunit C/Vma6|nr:V-type ATPase subunit [Candidatus Woesearchaeota archaeon]MDP7457538.1 V-type ATPase subunit [Candidatus Woesearchaeota archaeon]
MDVTIPLVIGAATLAGVVVIAPVTKYALDIYPFLYANTRCSSRLSFLLTKKSYEELLASTSKDEAFALLEDSYYSKIVEHSKDFFSFSESLEDDAYNTYNWLSTIVPPVIAPIINSLNMKFEISEIKKILNALKENKDVEEIKFISDPELKLKLESAKDFQSLTVALEGTHYNVVFQNKSLDQLSELNTQLDKYYLGNLISTINVVTDKKAAEPFLEYARVLIDMFNIRALIRGIGANKNTELIESGNLNKEELTGVTDIAQLGSTLTNSIYGEFIGDINNLNIENGFYKFFLKQAGNVVAKYTIKSGSVVRFIIMKEIETRNLNSLIKLKSEGFQQEKIRPLLMVE